MKRRFETTLPERPKKKHATHGLHTESLTTPRGQVGPLHTFASTLGDALTSAKKAIYAAPTPQCGICYDVKAINDFPNVGSISSHEHALSTCRDCLTGHIEVQINDKKNQITCSECPEHLSYAEVKPLVSEALFLKYDQAVLKTFVRNDADFRYCMSARCNSGQTHVGGEDEPIFRCEACGHKHRVVCEVPWHKNETCEQYQALLKNGDARSEAMVLQISKPCPQCKVPIEKNQGCDHMTCRQCRHSFCWNCLGDYYGHSHRRCNAAPVAVPKPRAQPLFNPSRARPSPEEARVLKQHHARLEAQQQNDQKSELTVRKISKICPNPRKCMARIEKNGGCDRMICALCGYQFCWVCLADYAAILRNDNRWHEDSCVHHPSASKRRTQSARDADHHGDDRTAHSSGFAPRMRPNSSVFDDGAGVGEEDDSENSSDDNSEDENEEESYIERFGYRAAQRRFDTPIVPPAKPSRFAALTRKAAELIIGPPATTSRFGNDPEANGYLIYARRQALLQQLDAGVVDEEALNAETERLYSLKFGPL